MSTPTAFGSTADGRRYSPAVAAMATARGIDLDKVGSSEDPGRISMRDVLAAAADRSKAGAARGPMPVTPQGYAPPRSAADVRARTVEVPSQFVRDRTVTIDPYGPNPLLEDLRQANPELAAAAEANRPPPSLFESGGDLPPFTASGIDPSEVLRVPYVARHAVASAETAAKALQILEDAAGLDLDDVAGQYGTAGLHGYRARMHTWSVDGMTDDMLSDAVSAGRFTAGGTQ